MFTKNLSLILLTNILLGAPMPMLIILGGLAGASLAPLDTLITVPVSAQLLAGILVASPLSLYMGRAGRKAGFLLVAATTSCGALMASTALYLDNFWLLCVAHLIMGAALVGVNFLRFAAAEVVDEINRPNAISFTLASGIIAALFGPSLFQHTQTLVPTIDFLGAYLAIAVLGFLGSVPVLLMSLSVPVVSQPEIATRRAGVDYVRQLQQLRPELKLAIGMAAVSQGMMVLMMVPTPQAMVTEGFVHAHAADVIRWHVVAMFAPGLITGILIKRFGLYRIIMTGLVFLLLAAILAMAGTGSINFYSALVLLGVGWNFGFIGGTQLLQQSTSAEEQARWQGVNDTIIAIASVGASVLSGVLYVTIGWLATSTIIVPIMLMAIAWLYKAMPVELRLSANQR